MKDENDIIVEMEEEIYFLRSKLEEIEGWTKAYPKSIFPEPNLEKARAALRSVNISLDAISATHARLILAGVRDILEREDSSYPAQCL